MIIRQIKASPCASLSGRAARSFSIGLFCLCSTLAMSTSLSAAEVVRSLSLEDRVRILEQQLSAANRMRAESQFETTNLKNEVRELLGVVEEQGYQLRQIIARQRELYKDIDNRLNEAESASQNQNTDVATIPQSSTTVQSDTRITDSTSTVDNSNLGSDELDDASIRKIYDSIFPLVKSKRYDDAIAGYQKFISDFPQSAYVANSRYWLAQIYVVQDKISDAEREYLIVAEKHSNSPKAVEAWLKLGKLYERLGQTDKAINAYNQVITGHSNSTASQMAVDRLQALKSQ